MTDTPAPPPGWAEAAVQAGTELGLGSAFAEMDPADRDRVRRRAGQILAGQILAGQIQAGQGQAGQGQAGQGQALPPGWERGLARLLGGEDPGRVDESGLPADEVLARDTADTVLAETGEVFAREDDA